MGNVPSDTIDADGAPAFAEAIRFKDELGDMQRALQELCASPSRPLLPHQAEIDGVVVTCQSEVRVLLGPVVGKVEFQTARVLLEVSCRASITCHVSTLNPASNKMAELPQCRCTQDCEPERPSVFRIARLAPGHDYKVCFSGLSREDAAACRGSFRTPSLESGSSELRAVAVSKDDPVDLEAGERNLWANVRELVERKDVDLVLHLGGQVAMKRMFDYGCMLLLRHANSQTADSDGGRNWKAMEVHATEVMRGAYRSQWSMSRDLQFVLANTSNLMMWSDADVYPQFTTRKEFYIDHDQPTLQMQVVRTATRSARRLFHEYQRQLWDDEMDQLLSREMEMVAIAESALESSGKIYKLSLQIPKVTQNLEVQKQRREIEGARRVEKQLRALETEKLKLEKQLVSFNQLLEPQRGEEFVYSFGSISILVLDMRSARLEPGGSQAADNPILSPSQWDFIDRVLEQSETKMLLVCTERPLIDNELSGSSPGVKCRDDDRTAWSNNPDAQERLLAMLFNWKLEQPSRQFVLLAGAGHDSTLKSTTKVKDMQLRTDTTQYVVGMMTAKYHAQTPLGLHISPTVHSSTPTVLHNNRFQVEHSYSSFDQKGFAIVSLKSSVNSDPPLISISYYEQQEDTSGLARVVLGPVVGWVDHKSATIMLEVDSDADIACVLTNPLTGEQHRVYQRFQANHPNSFHLSRLRSEHYYHASFTNIQEPKVFEASFTTLAVDPEKLTFVAVCNDNSLSSGVNANPQGTDTLWHTLIAQSSSTAFSEVNLTLHLGGQFFPDASANVHEALLLSEEYLRRSGSTPLLASESILRVQNRLKQLYRLEWTAPGVQEKLANGAHIILTNINDFLLEATSSCSLLVQQLLQKMHEDYFNHLLPPIMRQSYQAELNDRLIVYRFGKLGIFVMRSSSGSSIQPFEDDVWKCLDNLLMEESLRVLVMVTNYAIVEQSTNDLAEKAKIDDSYQNRFRFHQRDLARLLRVLFSWQQSQSSPTNQSVHVAPLNKQVILLSGSDFQSFDTVIEDFGACLPQDELKEAVLKDTTVELGTKEIPRIHQLVVGPLSSNNESRQDARSDALFFHEGTLFNRYTYKHSFARRETPPEGQEIENNQSDIDVSSGQHLGKMASMVSGRDMLSEPASHQFLHLGFNLSSDPWKSTSDIRELDPLYWGRFISQDRVAPRPVSLDNGPHGALIRLTYEPVKLWKPNLALPQWLKQLVSQPPTEDEQASIDARVAILLEKSGAIAATFELSPRFISSSLGFEPDPHVFISELSTLFSEFYQKLSGEAVREHFKAPPSPLEITLVLSQMLGDQVESFSKLEPVDAATFERILVRCFVDGWLLCGRLERNFANS